MARVILQKKSKGGKVLKEFPITEQAAQSLINTNVEGANIYYEIRKEAEGQVAEVEISMPPAEKKKADAEPVVVEETKPEDVLHHKILAERADNLRKEIDKDIVEEVAKSSKPKKEKKTRKTKTK